MSSDRSPSLTRVANISACAAPASSNKYDVFLSFRGPDTRRTFADYLYETLVGAGFTVFRDEEEIPRGGNIGPEIERAIDDSRIHMPIFSKGYASSAWCLQELARMAKRWREYTGQEIVPIFYNVSPSDVRLRTGSYGRDLHNHERRYGKETVRDWREALMEVGNLSGLDARKALLGKLVKDLVRELSIKLKKRQKVLPVHLVGIDDRVKDVTQWLCGSLDVRFLVVHGMGGIGKTTLVKAVFNEISPLFDGCSFLSNIRETSQRYGIARLQNQLLSDILKRSTDVHDVDEGVNMIREKFRNKRVLIVLDDVDEREQLMELTGNSDWLGLGSRIIVTTRNVGLLAMEEIGHHAYLPFLPKEYHAYEMKEMSPCHALQLFNKHAFGETVPPDNIATLSSKIVATTGRNPLALETIGSFLRSKSLNIWVETLERVRKVPDGRVQEKLKISYEALNFEEKQIFLDIACFFTGVESTSAIYVWKDSGFFPHSGLAALTDMSLLKRDHHNVLQMHDLIRDLGREIVREENYQNAGSRSRLWDSEECLRLLLELIGYQQKSNVQSFRLQFPEGQTLKSEEFAALPNLRCLHVEGVNFTGDYKNIFRELKWLSWDRCPVDFDATNFSPSNLVVLKLSQSELRDDWPGWHHIMKSSKLKFLELRDCSRLPRLPDLSALSTLETLTIRNCQSLVEIDESIGKLVHLNHLEINVCEHLRHLPEEVGCLKALKELIVGGTIFGPVGTYLPYPINIFLEHLTRVEEESVEISELPRTIEELKDLESLCLSRCCELRKLPDSIGELESLLELDLSYTKVTELPDSIENLRKLRVIRIDHSEINKIPANIGMVEKLEEFHAEKCVNLAGDVPIEIGSLSFLKILNLSHTCIQSMPTTINQLSHLLELHLEGCLELRQIPELPASLVILSVESRSLKTVPNLSNLTNLVYLKVSEYFEKSVSNPWDVDPIQISDLKYNFSGMLRLRHDRKSIIASPAELASLPGLGQLLRSCFELEPGNQQLPHVRSKFVEISQKGKLSPNPSSLELCSSWLMEIPLVQFGQLEDQFGQLEDLREVIVSNCAFLMQLSCLSGVEIQGLLKLGSVEVVRIGQCSSSVQLRNILKSKESRTMEFQFCRSLVSLPSLSQAANEDCHLLFDSCDKLSFDGR